MENATGIGLNTFLFTRLTQPTGISGLYLQLGFNNVFFSRARAMARFGLLMQGEGAWAGNPVLSDEDYFQSMITPSQTLNEAYGYLWWLNGSSTYLLPGVQFPFPGPAMPNVPLDTYAALGRDGQILNVSPSNGLVVVRMGASPGGVIAVPNLYNDEIWQYLNAVICTGTSIAEQEGDRPLFAPNPATDAVRVTGHGTSIVEAWAIGSDGRRHRLGYQGAAFQVAALVPGLYHVTLHFADGSRHSGRLVVQR
jgi:CubicO group peptidase (beta-lactamase class C family)